MTASLKDAGGNGAGEGTGILFDHPQVDTVCNKGADPVTGPADTTIVARFTVRSTAATPEEEAGATLPTTGRDGGVMPLILLWGTALLLPGIGALVLVPARRRRRTG